MFIQTWSEIFTLSFQNLWIGFISFVPNLILAVLIFIIGWAFGSILYKGISKIVNALKINSTLEAAGVHKAFHNAGISFDFGKILGELVRWFVVIVFLMTSLEIVGLSQVNDFLRDVVLGYLPQVIIASLVLVLAAVISNVVSKIVIGGARAANVPSVYFLGSIAKYAIWIFAFIIALSELGVAPQFMQILFAGIIAMLAIAGGLALGLGGKDVAGRALEKMRDELTRK